MGSIQEEWLIYFHDTRTRRYAKWIWWWKPPTGFAHCGALKYIPQHDVWEHIHFTHAGMRTEILSPSEANQFLDYLYDFEILICPVKDDWHLMRIKELSCVSFIMRLIGFYMMMLHDLTCFFPNTCLVRISLYHLQIRR